tara:strand:+ start:123 stop:431 length:309 start_codon:yes stop_codon:yes gene_type:complete
MVLLLLRTLLMLLQPRVLLLLLRKERKLLLLLPLLLQQQTLPRGEKQPPLLRPKVPSPPMTSLPRLHTLTYRLSCLTITRYRQMDAPSLLTTSCASPAGKSS